MTAVFCVNTPHRDAPTWKTQIEPFTHVEFAISDAAKGIAAAVEQVAAARRAAAAPVDATPPAAEAPPPLVHGLDLFHTTREANRVLATHWRRAEAAWDKAVAADVKVADAKRQGVHACGPAQTARRLWEQATAAFAAVERLDAAWRRIRAGFERFRPDGRLNDRAWAESEIAAALTELTDPEWKTVRTFVRDGRSLAFLDRMHDRLNQAEPRPEWREAMAWRWWLRHGQPGSSPTPWVDVVRGVGRGRELNEAERASYARVSEVLRDTVRASSAVECLNSVLRMQQSRHKRMSQSMLDLKRLYWNCHAFRSGPRKDVSPYRGLGLALPTYDFWTLLRADPSKLTQELSTQGNTK